MTEVVTPVAPVETPAAPATPTPAATPVAPVAAETVTLTKAEHEQLARDAARAASAQRKADLYDRHFGNNGGHFKPAAPVAPPSPEEVRANADAEDRKAERGLFALAADPAYRQVLDADPTLRNLLVTNPLAVLPMYASEALDAEDAIALVKEALDKRKLTPTPPTPPATPAPTNVPKPGAVTTPNDQTVDEAVESAKKNPNLESAIAGMIGARVRQGK